LHCKWLDVQCVSLDLHCKWLDMQCNYKEMQCKSNSLHCICSFGAFVLRIKVKIIPDPVKLTSIRHAAYLSFQKFF
jgi:hypothetical protein